jgi:hypothetical protein
MSKFHEDILVTQVEYAKRFQLFFTKWSKESNFSDNALLSVFQRPI